MIDTEAMKTLIRATYAARERGDVEGTLAAFADDVVFELNARGTGLPGMTGPVVGKTNFRAVLRELIDNFHFSDWREIALIAEGDKAALHWRATVTHSPTGRAETFDVVDMITFRDNQFINFHQNTDSAQIQALVSG